MKRLLYELPPKAVLLGACFFCFAASWMIGKSMEALLGTSLDIPAVSAAMGLMGFGAGTLYLLNRCGVRHDGAAED